MLGGVGRSIALAALGAVACGGSSSTSGDTGATRVFVGAVDGSDARVAVVTSGAKSAVYVCGGPASYTTITRWFDGAAASTLDLTKDGWSLSATVGASEAHGDLRDAAGATMTWHAPAAPSGTIAGLYVNTDDGCRTGLVVTQASASDTPTAQGVWCNAAGRVEQVTPVMPVMLREGAIAAQVQALGKTLTLRPFVPGP